MKPGGRFDPAGRSEAGRSSPLSDPRQAQLPPPRRVTRTVGASTSSSRRHCTIQGFNFGCQ
eukprot:2271744-Rhodomonas_salina.1